MPFSPIVTGSSQFVQSGPQGRYSLSSLAFGDPANYLQISGCTPVKKRPGTVAGGITYVLEKDVTINGLSVRKRAQIQMVLTVDQGMTATDIDNMLSVISDISTVSMINRMMNGES